jgi:hypothetical protein
MYPPSPGLGLGIEVAASEDDEEEVNSDAFDDSSLAFS